MANNENDANTEAQNQEETQVKFDKKWLKGLVFTTSKPKEIEMDSGKRTEHIPVEKPLTKKYVVDWKIVGGEVVIVAADGKKHRVKK